MVFRAFDSTQSQDITLKNSADSIRFLIPMPTSPLDMHESPDNRKLGLGLVKVVLLTKAETPNAPEPSQ